MQIPTTPVSTCPVGGVTEIKEITSYLEDQASKRALIIWANDGSISPL
jgi:hypothetical protein